MIFILQGVILPKLPCDVWPAAAVDTQFSTYVDPTKSSVDSILLFMQSRYIFFLNYGTLDGT